MTEDGTYRIVRPIDDHPVPFDQDGINEIWSNLPHKETRDAPSIDEAHEEYVETIAKRGEWHVFRVKYPFDFGHVVFWNGSSGEAFRFHDEEGSWHEFVNLLADIVESEGDCRDADYSSSLMPSGCYDQRCRNCGGSWSVG